ncbi:MAG: hypothetical protein K8R37_09830, partial [Bacteroidales bacterium]|nr:hypothetical protein [Bacteroidales bacterium]
YMATTGSLLSFTAGRIEDGKIQAYDGNLFMQSGAYIGANLIFAGLSSLDGTVQINGTGIEFSGNIINNGVIQNYNNVNSSLNINGNIINNGTITDPNYYLNLHITGNITNNGVWSNRYTNLTGTGTHILSQGSGAEFSGTNFTAVTSTGNITSLTDLTFNGTYVDLNGDTLYMATTGSLLSFTAGRIEDGKIQAYDGNLFMQSGAYIGSNFTITDITLEGIVQLNGTGIEFIGEIINNAYLLNCSGAQTTATITGNITNNDTITNYNSSYRLYLNVTGNITNNGLWANYYTNLSGTGTRTISQGTGAKFSGTTFTVAASAGIITSLSDLTFEGTNIDLNGDSLIMPATKGSVISLTGGRIEDGYVQSNFGALYMANGAYIGSNFTITDITLEGMVQLNGSGIEFI